MALSFGKIQREQLLLGRLICIACCALFALCIAITSKILDQRFNGRCVLYAEVTNSDNVLLITKIGATSTCHFINVLAELILISCPFLVIFLYVERGNEAHHPSAVLARRTITVFTLVFTVLILVQGCIASVGFAKLCKSVLETGRDKCDAKIGFWDTIRPCDKSNCSESVKDEEKFHSILTTLECLSWMLFIVFIVFNGINAVTIKARASKFQFNNQLNDKVIIPVVFENGVINTSKTATNQQPTSLHLSSSEESEAKKPENNLKSESKSKSEPKPKLRPVPPKPEPELETDENMSNSENTLTESES